MILAIQQSYHLDPLCLLPLGGGNFCLFEHPSAQPAYKSILPADVVVAEVTAHGALLPGFLTPSAPPPTGRQAQGQERSRATTLQAAVGLV